MSKIINLVLCIIISSVVNAQTVWGTANSRTETRTDAGLQGDAGAVSGFFEGDNPSNYPTGATSWWHLLDVRHSNPANNYAMQFAGSFFDQNLWFRKTNGNPAQAWRRIVLEADGKVGIGTQTPNAPLHILTGSHNSAIFETTVADNSMIVVKNVTGQVNLGIGSTIPQGYLWSNTDNFFIGSDGTPTIFVKGMANGNVGIGTTNPGTYKLAVEGTIGARKVKVTQDNWADYVFEKSYKLPTLAEVEQFIERNKHLPGVPSAKQVEVNGLDLGDNQAVLLKKNRRTYSIRDRSE